jgi:hypothetical protein
VVKRALVAALATVLAVAGAVLVLSGDGAPAAAASVVVAVTPPPPPTPTATPQGVRWGVVAHTDAPTPTAAAARPSPAASGPLRRGRGPVVAPYLTVVECIGAALDVHWAAIELRGHTWRYRLDHGTAVLWGHAVGGRYGPDGRWKRIRTTGGEHVLRWAGYNRAAAEGATYDAVRVEDAGYLSELALTPEECS